MKIVYLTGDIDYHTAPAARRQLLKELRGEDLAIDLADLTGIDTSGIATLVEILQIAHRRGRAVRLLHFKGNVLRMMRLAHIEELFSGVTR